MKKLIVQGTPGGEHLLIRKGKVAHGVKSKWQDVVALALIEDYGSLILDRVAIGNVSTEAWAPKSTVRP